jgi:hypothetical protein
MRIVPVAETALALPVPAQDGLYASIRLDDDDALASWFLERFSGYVQPAYAGHAVTFTSGVWVRLVGELHLERVWMPKSAQGLGYIAGPGTAYRSVFELGPHHDVQKKAPVILDERRDAFLRTIYTSGDTGGRQLRRDRKSLPVSVLEGFGLDQAAVAGLQRFMAAAE